MLILTRRPGESLIIETPDGKQIQVRIGTDALADISIVRDELLEGLQSQA
jgi:sRNA-binding carbon storage regulator CsrA